QFECLVLVRSGSRSSFRYFFFFQAEDGIRDRNVTGVQTCALPISAVGGDLAVARVKAHDDVAWKSAACIAQEAGVLDGGSAYDDVRDPVVQIAFYGVQVAYAAAYLYGDVVVYGRNDGPYGGLVFGFAGNGAVKVDQMQAPGALIQPLRGHGTGVVGKNCGIVKVALA